MRRGRIIAPLLAAIAIPGCSGAPITGPNLAYNASLIRQLDSAYSRVDYQVPKDVRDLRANEIALIMRTLAMGSPVQQLTVTIDSVPLEFNVTGMLWVDTDGQGNPVDSVYLVEAWRGPQADTIVAMQYWMYPVTVPGRVFPPPPWADVTLVAEPDAWIAHADSTTASYAQVTPGPGGQCHQIPLPSQVEFDPPPNACANQRVRVSYSAIAAPADTLTVGVHRLSLPDVPISGVRLGVPPQIILNPLSRVLPQLPHAPF